MAVMADVLFGGVPISGVTLAVRNAYIEQNAGEESARLVYHVNVTMPDGTVVNQGIGWNNVSGPVNPAGSVLPLMQAEAAMIARLQAAGATNIVSV